MPEATQCTISIASNLGIFAISAGLPGDEDAPTRGSARMTEAAEAVLLGSRNVAP